MAAGALRLEALAAIHRSAAGRLERNFRLLAARGTGRREHLLRPAKPAAPATAASLTATTTAIPPPIAAGIPARATLVASAAGIAIGAFTIPAGLGRLARLTTGLAPLGRVYKPLARKYLFVHPL